MILSQVLGNVLTHRQGPVLWGMLEGHPRDISGAAPVRLSLLWYKACRLEQLGPPGPSAPSLGLRVIPRVFLGPVPCAVAWALSGQQARHLVELTLFTVSQRPLHFLALPGVQCLENCYWIYSLWFFWLFQFSCSVVSDSLRPHGL